jgi:aminoglycoside 6'-N-acetyltransferase
MDIIKKHSNYLFAENDKYNIILQPLCDDHLDLLYKWCADSEILYWTEGGEDIVRSYNKETVHQIYGGISQNNLCFLIKVNSIPIGECWLQKMNIENVKKMYPNNVDVRRIDMAIGEKEYWNKGIGTELIKTLIIFAFEHEKVDVLHCLCEDYNIRSKRVWEKNNFKLILQEELPQPQKGKFQYHYRLTKDEYLNKNNSVRQNCT